MSTLHYSNMSFSFSSITFLPHHSVYPVESNSSTIHPSVAILLDFTQDQWDLPSSHQYVDDIVGRTSPPMVVVVAYVVVAYAVVAFVVDIEALAYAELDLGASYVVEIEVLT